MSLIFNMGSSPGLASGAVSDGNREVVRLGPMRFWAERGLIHSEDSRDNSYNVMSVRACLHRMRGLQDMLNNSKQRDLYSEDQFDQANRLRIQRYLENMLQICQKAQIQGMPSDPTARRALVHRRKKTFVNPGYGGGL